MSNLVAQIGLSTANLINGMCRAVSFLLILFVAGTFFSCGKDKLPKGVLSKEELSALMVDIYLAEARLSVGLVPRDSADKLFKPFQSKLLKDRGVSDSTMGITYQYYVQRPKDLEQIYDSVIDTLALREQRSKPAEPVKEAVQ